MSFGDYFIKDGYFFGSSYIWSDFLLEKKKLLNLK
jgi:hypothetical protein